MRPRRELRGRVVDGQLSTWLDCIPLVVFDGPEETEGASKPTCESGRTTAMQRRPRPHLALSILLALGAACLPASLDAAGPPVGAREVVRFAINAAGGEVALKRKVISHTRFTKIITEKGCWTTVRGEMWRDGPNRTRIVEHVSEWYSSPGVGSGLHWFTRTTVMNGDKFWIASPERTGPVAYLASEQMKSIMARVVEATSLLPLVEKPEKFKITFLRGEKIGKCQAVTLKVAAEGAPDVFLSFDRDTWLIVREEATVRPVLFAPCRFQWFYSDFKTVGGRTVPMKCVTVTDNLRSERVVTAYRLLPKADPALFENPHAKGRTAQRGAER
jgi:hypothetical protein